MITEKEYQEALNAIEEVIDKVNDSTDINDPNFIKLDKASDIVEAYETIHCSIGKPSFIEIIGLRAKEWFWKLSKKS